MDENNFNTDKKTDNLLDCSQKVQGEFIPIPDELITPPPVSPPPPTNEESTILTEDFEYNQTTELNDNNDYVIDEQDNIDNGTFSIEDNHIPNEFEHPVKNVTDATNFQPIQYYTPNPAKDPNVGGSKKGLRTFAFVLAIVILCIGSMSIGYLSASIKNGSHPGFEDSNIYNGDNGGGSTSSFPITQDSRDDLPYNNIQNVAAKVSPSVVNITTYNSTSGQGGYASGIIMSTDGYILTNDHIYSSIPNAKFLITLNDGTEYKAKYVSGDTRSDIAILKITDSVNNLVPATFGKSSEIVVGETVLAIGQSSGLSGTVSEGIVSALNRRVRGTTSSYSERHIQTTAAINPGNSGGALVNMQGQVIGVTSSKYVDENVEGICFAIPIDSAIKVVEDLQKHGKVVSRAKLGISYTAIGTVASEINKTPTGLYIQEISSESGLYGKGFSKGDVITHINGKVIKDDRTVLDIIENSKVGDILKLTIFVSSSSTSKTVDVKLVAAESGSSYTTEENPSTSSGNVFDVIPNPNNE